MVFIIPDFRNLQSALSSQGTAEKTGAGSLLADHCAFPPFPSGKRRDAAEMHHLARIYVLLVNPFGASSFQIGIPVKIIGILLGDNRQTIIYIGD